MEASCSDWLMCIQFDTGPMTPPAETRLRTVNVKQSRAMQTLSFQSNNSPNTHPAQQEQETWGHAGSHPLLLRGGRKQKGTDRLLEVMRERR